MAEKGTYKVKSGLAEMLKGGVIMDVTNAEQAKIAETAGAVSVMALERVPSDIRAEGGVARMTDPIIIKEIIDTVSIPVMAKVRIGHFVEAQILESLGVDYGPHFLCHGLAREETQLTAHSSPWIVDISPIPQLLQRSPAIPAAGLVCSPGPAQRSRGW